MKALNIIKYVFSIIGLLLLAGGYAFYNSTQSLLDIAETAEAEVIDLIPSRSDGSTTYAPLYEFTTQSGRQVQDKSSTSSNPPAYNVGEKVTVYYDPDQPSRNRLDGTFSLWGGAMIMGGMGLVFFGIGASFFVVTFLKQARYNKLKENGTPVFAEYTGVNRNTSISVNGRHPFVITAQWHNPADNTVYIFESDNLWFDPSDHIHDKHLTVLIDQNNPKNHMMDISFLPKTA